MQSLQISSRLRAAGRATALAVVIGVAMPAAGAQAQGCQGAPGASALEQYCEAIPRADGGRERPSSSGSGSGGSGSQSGSGQSSGVSSSTSSALSKAGADGQAVERLASGSTAKSSKSSSGKSKSSKDSAAGSTPDQGAVKSERVEGPADPSSSPLKAATNAAGAGPTVGGGLVWGLLGISALGAAGAVFMRRGNGFGSTDDE